ncbi:MAG: uncharacterized protein H6Q89_2793 [Myxococcaceae bacterium]|nr:uncharacterized protein [Myxococcaceae bacterium]
MKAPVAFSSIHRLLLLGALGLTGCLQSTRVSGELNWTIPPTSEAPASADAGVNLPPRLVFAGNRVLSNDVYIAAIGLKEFTADPETAADIQRRLTRFLREAGYELSSVHCIAHDNQIDIGINEGRLEKIVYRGRLSVQSLQFTFALELPHEVFNRPELERQTAALEARLGIGHIWFVLVPTAQVTHMGPQLERLPEIRGFELLHEREPWELHFFFTEREWGTGAGIDLKSSYTDGLEVGVNYMKEGLLLDGDRARFAASGGLGLRNRLSDNGIYPFFSRTAFDVRWYSPPIVADVRPALILKGDLVARQEIDKLIQLENYYAGTASGSFNLSAVVRPGMIVAVGAGVQWRRIWGLDSRGAIIPPTVHFTEEVRAFFEGKLDLIFDPANNRTDRWHLFAAEAVTFAPASVFRDGKLTDPWFGSIHFRYQNVIPFGWHDVWIRARGRTLLGQPGSVNDSVSFHDEDSVAEYNHGIFGDKFIRRGASAEVEFRFSITRDLFKISVFHSIFAFGEVTDRGYYLKDGTPVYSYAETPRLGTAVGPGFHALIEGMFQLDIYGSFGVLNNGQFSANATLNLNKVF